MARSTSEGPFTADLRGHPRLRLMSPHVASHETVNIASYFACVDGALALDAPFVVLHDVRDIPHIDDARRCEFMRQLDARRPEVEARLLGYAALVGSPLERGIVTAFAWFARLPVPVRLFTREVEANAWLDTRLGSSVRRARA